MISTTPPVKIVEVKKEYLPYRIFDTERQAQEDQKKIGGFLQKNYVTGKWMLLYIPKGKE